MSIESEHQKQIETYIKDNPDCNTQRKILLEIKGKATNKEVYRLPTNLLAFNVESGRFAADFKTMEKKQGRKLNPWDSHDRLLLKKMLLETDPMHIKQLREDIERVGQLDPGIITAAGLLINANRRMAVLMDLREKKNLDKFDYIDVIILPPALNDVELYKIEAKLQYAKDLKVAYSPINTLLKIKEGLAKRIKIGELAAILGVKNQDIEADVKRLELMEDFSKYAWGLIDYKKLEEEQVSEHFIDMQKNLEKYSNEGYRPTEIRSLVKLHFALIKAGYSHLNVRKLGNIDGIEKAKKAYFEALDKYERKKVSDQVFIELVDDANEEVRIKKKQEKPIEQIKHALSILKRIEEEQLKITSAIKKDLIQASKIIDRLLKKSK